MLEFVDDVRSSPQAAGRARHKVVDFAKLRGFPALRISDVELAVAEACANPVIATRTLRGGQIWGY